MIQVVLVNIMFRNLNTHTFRIGGASAAASAGVPDSVIQILGRWKSDAYRRYIRLSDTTVADVTKRIISQIPDTTRFWDIDTGSSYRADRNDIL